MEEIHRTVHRHGGCHPPAADGARTATSVPHGKYPGGLVRLSSQQLKNLDETTLRCFNYSHNEWQVIREGDGVKITKLIKQKSEDAAMPSLPPLLKHEEGMPGRTVSAGLR